MSWTSGDSTPKAIAVPLLNDAEFIPVVFIDDNQSLRGNTIHGIRVHNSANLSRLVDDYGIKRILLAIPSATMEQRGRILDELSRLPIQISTVPDISQLITGQADVAQIEAIDISDLLGRDMVPPDANLLRHSIEQKSVLDTYRAPLEHSWDSFSRYCSIKSL